MGVKAKLNIWGSLMNTVVDIEKEKINSKSDNYNIDLARASGDRWITMANKLTHAGHGLSLSEKRIMACAISKLDSKRVYPEIKPIRITAQEYAEVFDVDLDTAYSQLNTGAAALFEKKITFYEPAYKRGKSPIKPTKVNQRWLTNAKYQDGLGWVEITFAPEIKQYLTGLRKQFTSYQLKQASALRSAYSWRLLELLTGFQTDDEHQTGWAEFNIEDFCIAMDATEKQASDFAKVRTKIIEPAVKELCQKDGWDITWEPKKNGRKVTALRFEYKRNPQIQLL